MPAISRLERFDVVASTQDIVASWLESGEDEVCVAVADLQTTGRGRLDRLWQADAGRALLVSAGFRPVDLPLGHAWRLPAVAALAMLEAAAAQLADDADALALKWPNDIVATHEGRPRKVAGVLSSGVPEGDRLASAVVGIGINVAWPEIDFPAELADTMWSLQEANGGRSVDRELLLEAWLERLERGYRDLAAGRFDAPAWSRAQVTTGSHVEVDAGADRWHGRAVGVDAESGALLLETEPGQAPRGVLAGDVLRCRLAEPSEGPRSWLPA